MRLALALAAVAVAVLVTLVVWHRGPAPASTPPGDAPAIRSAVVEPALPPPDAAAPVSPPPASAATAEHAVERQLRLIDDDRVDELRATFTAEVRDRVTPATVEACRRRVHQVPVRPDWEMAETTTGADGLRVRSVSMFGKSLTGFHEQRDGRWLADALWCLPVGLP